MSSKVTKQFMAKHVAKSVAIVQSNYIPWKGYFDLINRVDEFVLYDDMQYTRRDWRNRNKIKTAKGLEWLTLAVKVKGKYHQAINETKIDDAIWAKRHVDKIRHAYQSAPYFTTIMPLIESWYDGVGDREYLSEINRYFIEQVCAYLGIKTRIRDSREFNLVDGKSERLLGLCKDLEAICYYSGPAAKDYLDEALFAEHQVQVRWMDYSHYPDYQQIHGEFAHGVSIFDVLFHCGPDSLDYVLTADRRVS